jgi:sporulation protein YqfD
MLGLGLMTAFLTVFWLCARIWVVDAPLPGIGPPMRQALIQAAAEAGLAAGARRSQINPGRISLTLEQKLHGYSWIRVSLHGVVAEIQAAKTVARPTPAFRVPPRLVAGQAGKVLAVEVFVGDALVGQGQVVQQGQTLIQGARSSLARNSGGAERVVTSAVGQVWADVAHRIKVYQPLVERLKIPQNRSWTSYQLLVADGPSIRLRPFQPPFRHYRTSIRLSPIIYRGVEMPLEWRRVVYNEIKEASRRLTVKEAIAQASLRAEREIALTLPKGGRWIHKTREIRRTKSGIWVMLDWHAEQNIATAPRRGSRVASD